MKLSIVISVFNEKNTITEILKRIEAVDLDVEKEIIIVDDFSTDGTRDILEKLDAGKYKIIFQEKNCGKGAALKKGFLAATGDIVLIQDADLEYDPEDYPKLIGPILANRADVVYGSRFLTTEPKRVFYIWHLFGNLFLTGLSDLLTGLNFSDIETCYKAFRKEVVDSFKHQLKSERFGIDPELTALVAKGKPALPDGSRGRWRIYEVGVSYYGRSYAEGKKINWKDGLAAIWHIIKFNLFR